MTWLRACCARLSGIALTCSRNLTEALFLKVVVEKARNHRGDIMSPEKRSALTLTWSLSATAARRDRELFGRTLVRRA